MSTNIAEFVVKLRFYLFKESDIYIYVTLVYVVRHIMILSNPTSLGVAGGILNA